MNVSPLQSELRLYQLGAIIMTTWILIIVVCLAGYFAYRKQNALMRGERRDRLRMAYSTWLNALDLYSRALPAVRFATPTDPASNEDQSTLEVACSNEAAAFTYVLLLDPEEGRIDRAEKIRSLDTHDKERIQNAAGKDIHERIWNVRREDEKALHQYVRQVCKELKEPV
jgi:hypothetical protein